MDAATRVLPAVILLLVSGALSACGSEGGDPDDGDTTPGDVGGDGAEPVETTVTFDESQCASAYPIPLTVSTSVDAERDYVQNVVTCTSDAQYGPVWLHNAGDEVWRFDSGAAEFDFVDYTDESAAFAAIFDDPPILVPDDVLVIDAPPSHVSWTLDTAYTIAWETQSEAIAQLEGYGPEAVFLAVKRQGTPARAALAACALTAYDVASEWTDDPDGFDENFAATLATGAGTGTCATKWQSAWTQRFAPSAQFLDEADTSFRLLSRLGRLAVMIR